ncbi:hypothetical protein QVD17_18268 [Tagetes erecta]|uniref:Uncharacterized protein n=1 Tax=Tagetes erecta TaxID=13708 RepID=A0AAD8KKA7_TARER|nr:hypothetical protein QVD17_18268 [Tagetes erecta]
MIQHLRPQEGDEEGDERACGRGEKLVEEVGRDSAVRGRGEEQTRRRRGPLLLRRACDKDHSSFGELVTRWFLLVICGISLVRKVCIAFVCIVRKCNVGGGGVEIHGLLWDPAEFWAQPQHPPITRLLLVPIGKPGRLLVSIGKIVMDED